MYTANISEINPLIPGHFLIVMHPGSKEVVAGEGKPKFYLTLDSIVNNNTYVPQLLQCTQRVVLAMPHINGYL